MENTATAALGRRPRWRTESRRRKRRWVERKRIHSRSEEMDCTLCGGCCVAPDIAALDKPLGRVCVHLADDLRCAIYERRPDACRAYQPDELCERIAAPTLAERVALYLAIFDLTDEAERVRVSGALSMREARRLRLVP